MNKIYFQLIVALGLLLTNTFAVTAQNHQEPSFLYQVGQRDSLYSEVLKEGREVWIQLPETYNPNSDTKYPVVYVLDGRVQLKGLATVSSYYYGHFLPDMILVGISSNKNRTRDLTTSKVKERHGYKVQEETGGAEKFTQFIEKELIPYIDSKYPTTPYRTLIGHSYGGLFTINTLLHHPTLFENYIAIDPSLDWDDQQLLKEAQAILPKQQFKGKSLFVSMATTVLHMQNSDITMDNVMQDTSEHTLFARSIISFANLANQQKSNGLNFDWKSYANGLHGTVPLPSMIDGLVFLFEWYQLKDFAKVNHPDTSAATLIELLKEREKTLTAHFGYPSVPEQEPMLNQLGYMFLDMGQTEKSKVFFEMGMHYFPQSANTYDSMADFYEAQEDLANAIKYVTKAFEISGSDYHKERLEKLKGK